MFGCYIHLILLKFGEDLGNILSNAYAKFQNNWLVHSGNMIEQRGVALEVLLSVCQLGLWFLRTALLFIDIYPFMKSGVETFDTFCVRLWKKSNTKK